MFPKKWEFFYDLVSATRYYDMSILYYIEESFFVMFT